MMRSRQLRPGMTLMELVIAITILAIMATAGTAAFATVIDRQETIRNASTEVERAAALRETIRQWILQGEISVQRGGLPAGGRGGAAGGAAAGVGRQIATVAPGGRVAANAGVTSASSTGHELTVTTNAPNPLMGAAVRIRLFVDTDANSPEEGLTIEYQASAQGSPLLRRQLDPSVGDLTIEFYDPSTGRWVDSAQAATLQNPIALRLSMVPAEGKLIPRLLELPLTLVFGEVTP